MGKLSPEARRYVAGMRSLERLRKEAEALGTGLSPDEESAEVDALDRLWWELGEEEQQRVERLLRR